MRLGFALAFGAALLMISGVSQASAIYPGLVQSHLGLTYSPRCTLCHRDDHGGAGTVTTLFGRTMLSLNLVAESAPILYKALDDDRADHRDSDGDGVGDIDELVVGTDPNDPTDAARASPTAAGADAGDAANVGDAANTPPPRKIAYSPDPVPEYGCAVGSAVRAETMSVAPSVGALVVLVSRRARAKRERRRA